MAHSTAQALRTVRQWQSEVDAITEAPEPKKAQSAVLLLAGMVTALVAVTPFVSVDRVVSSTAGKIVSSEALTTFQALDPSIIKSVNVHEGETVRKNQVLATLDATFAQADAGQLHKQFAAVEAQIARLTAEQKGLPLTFPSKAGTERSSDEMLQTTLFNQRAAEYAAQMRLFDEKAKTTQATIAKLSRDEALLSARENISQQVETMRDTLYKTGSSSRLNLLQANDARLEMQRTTENTHNSLTEAQHQLSSAQAERDTYVQKHLVDIAEILVTARNTRDTTVASLLKASKHQDLVRLAAPDDAIVLTLSKLSVGSVLKEGDSLMTLAPLRAPMEAEIHIASKDIGFVRTSDPVSLKVDAFNFYEHGSAVGRLKWISEGTFTTDDSDKPVEPFYKAHVSIDDMNFTGVPKTFRLMPGMTLRADIELGQRSLFRYFLGGFVQGTGEAMREP